MGRAQHGYILLTILMDSSPELDLGIPQNAVKTSHSDIRPISHVSPRHITPKKTQRKWKRIARQLRHGTKEKLASRKRIAKVLVAGSPSKEKTRTTIEVSDDSTLYHDNELVVVVMQHRREP